MHKRLDGTPRFFAVMLGMLVASGWLAGLGSGGCSKRACHADSECGRSCAGGAITGDVCVDAVCRPGEPYDCASAYGAGSSCAPASVDGAPRCIAPSCASAGDCPDRCRDDGLLIHYGCEDAGGGLGKRCAVLSYTPAACTPETGGGGAGGAGGAAGGAGGSGGAQGGAGGQLAGGGGTGG